MADPFVAEIRMCPFNFAPKGWAFCDGQIIPIAQNTALFSLLGTTYGGDGRTIFALPNMQGRAPMHPGNGPGLTPRALGEAGGAASVTLAQNQLPGHTHTLSAFDVAGTSAVPTDRSLARSTSPNVYATTAPSTTLGAASLNATGGSQPHNNMPPYLTVNFIIAMVGIFPPRT